MFLYNPATKSCQDALSIKNNQLEASADQGNEEKARLDNNDNWDSGSGPNPGWIQVDFVEIHTVTGVKTRVAEENSQYSLTFKVLHSTAIGATSSSLKTVQNENGSDVS